MIERLFWSFDLYYCLLLCCPAGYVWASEAWKDATWRKVPAVQQLLGLGYNVLLSDIDVMWLADPLAYLAAVPSEVR
jgi:hypothetical protein